MKYNLMDKLTHEELESLREANKRFNDLKVELANSELRKQGVLKEIEILRESFASIERSLAEKYGESATINLDTGEVKHSKLKVEK